MAYKSQTARPSRHFDQKLHQGVITLVRSIYVVLCVKAKTQVVGINHAPAADPHQPQYKPAHWQDHSRTKLNATNIPFSSRDPIRMVPEPGLLLITEPGPENRL